MTVVLGSMVTRDVIVYSGIWMICVAVIVTKAAVVTVEVVGCVTTMVLVSGSGVGAMLVVVTVCLRSHQNLRRCQCPSGDGGG